jgi:NAD(P)-dependent dehydrogenase (short-subunit alcohol dehydrogenase family)
METTSLEGRKVLVTGGSRGLGLGIVEALVAREATVTVLARDRDQLAAVKRRLAVAVIPGDVTDAALAARVLADVQPDVLVLNAGATPPMASLLEQTWDSFSACWDVDVKAAFHWVQAALRLPLRPGSQVLVGSSGAAVGGSPLSGGYAGAKRMSWLLASYARDLSTRLNLGIHFQALLPMQMVGGTGTGTVASEAYARQRGITPEQMLAGFGEPMLPRGYGEHVVAVLTDPQYSDAVALGIKSQGITPMEARLA